jgi:2-dehydro-3-deoxyphosphogluconate aldolase / (4S)-4-hydroxy-2-oxoglutarate aldolase
MTEIYDQIGVLGIVPVVVIEDEAQAEPLAEALSAAGLPCAEITFRTTAAAGAIYRISKSFPMLLVGAGTVLNVDQAKKAVDNGARFIVSPGTNRKVLEYCNRTGIPAIPGVVTPSELMVALELGHTVVKFFPAEACGGISYLRALAAPFGGVRFIPTGGIDESNLLPYLKHPAVLACGGSWMVKQDAISSGKFDDIRTITQQAVSLVLGFDLRHVGINSDDAGTAQSLALRLSDVLNIGVKDGNSSLFVGSGIEILKKHYLGKNGHLALSTNSIPRALAWFARKGIKPMKDTENYKDGKLMTVYLDLDMGGFAVHLVQK